MPGITTKLGVTAAVAAALLAAGCASTPERIPQLEQARAAVSALEQDPIAQQAAGRELQLARERLGQADAAKEARRPQPEIEHLAYLAERHAQVGTARIAEQRAREQVATAEAERNRVLLEARSRDAQRAQQMAQQAQQTAEARAAEAERQRAEALRARADLERMQREFQELQAKQTERGMVLTLGDVLFDTGEATLKPGAALALDRLAKFMQDNPRTTILVEGHTDSRGDEGYNQQLSERRAQAVAQALAERGVPGDRYRTIGRGEGFPVASNDSPAGRQQNRRVEIVFSDPSGRFAQSADQAATLR